MDSMAEIRAFPGVRLMTSEPSSPRALRRASPLPAASTDSLPNSVPLANKLQVIALARPRTMYEIEEFVNRAYDEIVKAREP